MNREEIEIIAVSKLKTKICLLGYTVPEITENDKSPSWDGYIKLYKTKEKNDKQGLKRLPVQVKGHYQKPAYDDCISFPVERFDLENWLNERGCILFVIYIDEKDNYKIYYQTLSPFKLRRLLKGKEKQKNISIHLESLPTENDEIMDIFFKFAHDIKYSLSEKEISITDYFEGKLQDSGYNLLTATYNGVKYKNDPIGGILNTKPTLFLQNSKVGTFIPIETDYELIIESEDNKPIYINNIQYFNSFKKTRQKNDIVIIQFGKSFSFNLHVTDTSISGKFFFSIKGNLTERINDTKFLLSLLNNKCLTIGNTTMKMPISDEEIKTIDIEYYENNLRLLEYTEKLLSQLNVDTILNYDNITEYEEKNLVFLINTVLLGAKYIHEKDSFLIHKIKIANLNLLFVEDKINDESSYIYDYFDERNKLKCIYKQEDNDKNFIVPNTFILQEEDFINLDNINYEKIFKDIVNTQTTPEQKACLYQFIQGMISGYKKRSKQKDALRKCIKKVLEHLRKNSSKDDYLELKNEFEEST